MSDTPQNASTIVRAEGITSAERYLQKLCEHSFLTLWSYAGLYRDQGKPANHADGKELCDLLVVFENHIIIFSDKDCQFGDSGNLPLDWNRWVRKTVFKSADQVWGAERWIKQFPDRIFLDRACTIPFPYALPDPSVAQFHRVVVAHAAAERCRDVLGGSGSLMIDSTLEGDKHFAEGNEHPFTIGHIDRSKGFVHIFDDTSLDIVMKTLDTITDFVRYLTKKEQLLTSGQAIFAAGEEELIALYLHHRNDNGEHDFNVDKTLTAVAVQEGFWKEFVASDARRSQVEADKVSQFWDILIERFNRNIITKSLYDASDADVSMQEQVVRWLARESRFRRRALSLGLLEIARKTRKNTRMTRVVLPWTVDDPHYVFLVLPHPPGVPMSEYRAARQDWLAECCYVTKVQCPEAQHIIGIATEAGWGEESSEDLMYLDVRNWTDEEQKQAEQIQQEFGILTKVSRSQRTHYEYPAVGKTCKVTLKGSCLKPHLKGNARNQLCPCGSGKKYKHCCGRPTTDN